MNSSALLVASYWSDLDDIESPGFVLRRSPRSFNPYVEYSAGKRTVRAIRGSRCSNSAACWREFGASLQCNFDSDDNWHSIRDALGVVNESIPPGPLVLVVTGAAQVYADEPSGRRGFLKTLHEAMTTPQQYALDLSPNDELIQVIKVVLEVPHDDHWWEKELSELGLPYFERPAEADLSFLAYEGASVDPSGEVEPAPLVEAAIQEIALHEDLRSGDPVRLDASLVRDRAHRLSVALCEFWRVGLARTSLIPLRDEAGTPTSALAVRNSVREFAELIRTSRRLGA